MRWIARNIYRPKRLAGPVYRLLPLLLLSLLTAATKAQLPPGTTDASARQTVAPSDPRLAQATEALEKQDYTTAITLLTALIANNPKDAHLFYDLGFAQDSLDRTAAATESYRNAIAADPTYFEPHLALGLLLARNGQAAEAHGELAHAVTLEAADPNLKARAYRALARLDETGNPVEASTDLLAALKLSPESPDDALLAGELAQSANDAPSAEAAYRRILAARPGDAAATSALAHLLLRLNRAPEAEPLLTAALAKHRADPALTSQLAATYAAEGHSGQAIVLIEELHTASPADDNITRLLAHLYSDNKEPEKAAPLYADLVTRFPKDIDLLADQGGNLLRQHNYIEAESVLTRATATPAAFSTPANLGHTAEDLAFAASHNDHPGIVLQALTLRATVLPQSPAALFLAATAHDSLHQTKQASELYRQFLTAAAGKFPDQEWEASHRLIALQHMK